MIELYRLYVDSHNENPYSALSSSVAISLLTSLYKRFLKDKEIKAIEELSQEKKDKYLEIGKKFETEKYKKFRIARAAYTLDLISANE